MVQGISEKKCTYNYYNIFIHVAEDGPAHIAEIPPLKGNDRTVANIQFEMIKNSPYKHSSGNTFLCVFNKK